MTPTVFMESMKLVDKVEKWCEAKKRTRKSVAVAAGFVEQRLQDWKNPSLNRKPTLAQALAMAREMKVTLDSLADDEVEFLVPSEDPNFTYLLNVITDLGLTWRQAAQILMQAGGPPQSGSRPVGDYSLGEIVGMTPTSPALSDRKKKRTDTPNSPTGQL